MNTVNKPISPFQNIKVISFDLDDTLWSGTDVIIHAEKTMTSWMVINTPKISQSLSNEELRSRKIQFIKSNPKLRYKISQARIQFLTDLFSEFNYPQPKELAKECFQVFYDARQKVTLFENVIDVLTELNKKFTLIAITNGNANVQAVGLEEYFDFCLNSEDFDFPKPHGDIFQAALAKAGISADQCLHVGDHPEHDMLGAKEVGIKTCWLEDGRHPWQHDFKADITITHVRELLPLLLAQ